MEVKAKMVQPYSHDLICGNIFEMTERDAIQQLDQSSFSQLFQKISLWGSNLHPI